MTRLGIVIRVFLKSFSPKSSLDPREKFINGKNRTSEKFTVRLSMYYLIIIKIIKLRKIEPLLETSRSFQAVLKFASTCFSSTFLYSEVLINQGFLFSDVSLYFLILKIWAPSMAPKAP